MAQELKAYTFDDMLDGDADIDVEYYRKSEVDTVLAEKDAEIRTLKQKLMKYGDTNVFLAKENTHLKLITESKDSEIRRLKRALYKACANWAMAESYSVLNDVPTSNRWVHTLNKCRAKAEEYK